ncbi:MAG: DUF5803 family protein [Haloplanus sp.]
MNRRYLLPLALVALVLTSGCAGFFGSQPISDERLDEEPPSPYAWESDVNAHITITENARFQAVYRLNDTSMELFRRDGFGGRNAIPVSAVRYRYPNGTVITGTEIRARGGAIERSRERVSVTLPADAPSDGPTSGRLAFTSSSTPKRFSLPTFVNGSYAVVLPPNRRVEVFPFGKVSPRGYEVESAGDRRIIRWENVEADSISVQFYLQRDLLIFGGAAVGLAVVGIVGVFYYRRRIEALRKQREELGLDVDTEDDEFRDDPPPGMG